METTKGWCTWHVSLDYLCKALSQLTATNAQHIQIVNSRNDYAPFLIVYYNPPNHQIKPTNKSRAKQDGNV